MLLKAGLFLWFAGLGVLIGFAAKAQQTTDPWFIDPGGTSGFINRSSSETDLIQHFGAKNVKWGQMNIGEGEQEPATILFSDDPESRIAISWHDADKRVYPSRVQLDGGKSHWHTSGRITLGTTLKEIETLNAGPFTMYGFGWDYDGTVSSWDNGKLEEPLRKKGHVILRLIPSGSDVEASPEYQSVLGERAYSSANPAMQKLNPTVYQIICMFK